MPLTKAFTMAARPPRSTRSRPTSSRYG